MADTYVIGVAAPAGGGKTTLVDVLADRIPGALTLRFDDFDVGMPDDMESWLAAGAHFSEWRMPGLEQRLFELTVETGSPGVVVFEAPLGRAHHATGNLIDFVVFIDTPLEVALARWLRRRLRQNDPADRPDQIVRYLDLYEPILRRVYLEQQRQVRASADLVLAGLDPVDRWVDQVLAAIPDR